MMSNDTAKIDSAGSLTALLKRIDDLESSSRLTGDATWVLVSFVLIIFMQIGFAMLESGSVRDHNVIMTYVKNVLDCCISVIVAVSWSYSIANPGGEHFFAWSASEDVDDILKLLSFIALQSTAATIMGGAVAERMALKSFILLSVCLASSSFPLAVRWCWVQGPLVQRDIPYHDFAGAGVVHYLGGLAALLGSIFVGPRLHRWDEVSAADFAPHNVSSVLCGTLMLWVGWYGFNAGSTGAMSSKEDALVASNVALCTALSASAGGLSTMIVASILTHGGKLDVVGLSNGIISGLVAITASCDCIVPGWSLLIGAISGIVYTAASFTLTHWRVDDVVGAWPAHGACGIWGVLAVGLWHESNGLFMTGDGRQLLSQLLGLLLLTALLLPFAIVLALLRWRQVLRVDPRLEEEGLDSSFGLHAYERHKTFVERHKMISQLLRESGYSPTQLLSALRRLDSIIARPLSPQAGDFRLEGEVRDILRQMKHDDADGRARHYTFLSHYKSNGGESARILADTIRRLVAEEPAGPALSTASSETCESTSPQETGATLPRVNFSASCSSLGSPVMSRRSRSRSQTDLSDIAANYTPEELVFLDSSSLNDKEKLREHLLRSSNYILLLTHNVLERPWVLFELCTAFLHQKNILVVWVDSPSKGANFAWPGELDRAIANWSWFLSQRPERKLQRRAKMQPVPSTRCELIGKNHKSKALKKAQTEDARTTAVDPRASDGCVLEMPMAPAMYPPHP